MSLEFNYHGDIVTVIEEPSNSQKMDMMVTKAKCNECGEILPPHTVRRHIDKDDIIHKCPHTEKRSIFTPIDKLILKIVNLKSQGGGKAHYLPIKQISGVRVDCVQIHVAKTDRSVLSKLPHHKDILLKIDTDYLPHSIYAEWFDFTKETAKETIQNIIELIKNLKLDKTTNYLRDQRIEVPEQIITPQDTYDLFACENVKLEFNECCVCHEITNSYFRECKHTICFECCSKLIIEDDCVTCPMCRDEACICSSSNGDDTLLDTY